VGKDENPEKNSKQKKRAVQKRERHASRSLEKKNPA
jgi:hypothetical protein